MKQPLRIAIADDEADIRQYFRRLLPKLGHKVVAEAKNGRELVELCRTENPDLVITDIKMPEMDGFEAITEIGKYMPVPVIIISSQDPSEQCKHFQIVESLVKPISISDLQAAILKAQLAAQQIECGMLQRTEPR